MDATILHS
jgi:hypothetical protein